MIHFKECCKFVGIWVVFGLTLCLISRCVDSWHCSERGGSLKNNQCMVNGAAVALDTKEQK